MKRKPNCACVICGSLVYRRPTQISSGNVYCSRRCTGVGQQKLKVCRICNTTYVGGKKTCSRACANKARTGIRYTRDEKFDRAYQGSLLKEKIAKKRGGICERCGENNYAILQVHHKKERYNGGTDHVRNLELLCPNCHATHHLGKSLFQETNGATVAQTKIRSRRGG